MKRDKIIYWIATGLMCLIFFFSSMMYFFNYEYAAEAYINLGFPAWMVYPSAIAKLLGITAVLTRRSPLLKEWAYAGFFFDAAMAFTAHTLAGDGQGGTAAIVLIAVVVSRIFEPRVFGKNE